MDLPAVQVRVIREVNDLEKLIAELTSPYCTLEALKVEKGQSVKFSAIFKGGEIRERFASALGASKTLKSLDVAFCSDMLNVDDLCTLLESNKVLKSLTVCIQFAGSFSVASPEDTSLSIMLKRNSTLKQLRIAQFDNEYWHPIQLATVLSQSLLEQLTIEFYDWEWLLYRERIFEVLAENTNLRSLELICTKEIFSTYDIPLDEVENALSAVFSRNEASDHQANETLTRLALPMHCVIPIAAILRSNRTIRELVLTKTYFRRDSTVSPEDIVTLLEALQQNYTLRLLDLSGCSAVQERQDLSDAILNCLEAKSWLHLNLQDTPLSESDSRFPTIQQKLQQNEKFREAFGNWNPQLVNSTGARVFLCGSPRAGKCRSHLP
jgi:hypothetical protein